MSQLPVPFWSFDRKQDYRHLLNQRNDLLVLPWTQLKFNPLKPPDGVPPRRWAQVFSEIFSHSTDLLSGSTNYLLKQVIQLYKLYDLFTENSPPYPSTHELELLIEEEKLNYVRKQANYRDTVLNRLETLNLTAGTVFDCSTGFTIAEQLEQDVIFELDGLNRDVQNFITEILFAYVYEYRLSEGHRSQGLNHVFFLDEAKQVFSVYKERQDAAGIPEIDEITAKMREFGEGLVVGDQEASKLTESIKANTYTKLLLSTGDRNQFNAVSNAMNLSEQQRNYAQQLGVGEAVLQSGNGTPVPVNLRNHPIQKDITDQELEHQMAEKWEQLPVEKRERPIRFKEYVAPGRSNQPDEPEIVDDPQQVELSNEAQRFLKDIVENPFKPLTQRYEKFSSRYKGNKAKNELLENGVVIERTVSTGDGRLKLLEFTDKGRTYLEDQDIETHQEGRGGVVHQYWQQQVQELFGEAGWTAQIEVFDADAYVHMDEVELAVEIAMGPNDREIEHVEKHLSKDFEVWIVCRNPEVKTELQSKLKDKAVDEDCVQMMLVHDLVNIDPDRPTEG
ncbi:ATP-binding protein [Halogeometricum sp. CBA1124]|uniref:ATP-binding protein n=1 Tax=Halogeometricum sp. CBA1124 TaxID=2668071 RepID=UPI00142CED52|nr:ATP-binding protein [Halogeometricum sp. CBA1124]MUV56726.1 ATP-binding protein [Halogeometricum sp. CBA1124]